MHGPQEREQKVMTKLQAQDTEGTEVGTMG